MQNTYSDIIILGSGPAGVTAGIYSGRAMRTTTLITGKQYGGQLTMTSEIENFPGFIGEKNATELVMQMLNQAEQAGANIVNDTITSINLEKYPIEMQGSDNQQYRCKALIIATGAKAKWLGLESEQSYIGYGVSSCATCDGFFYRGKNVAVIGGGNSAVDEALYLSNIAKKVVLIHRRDTLTAEKLLIKRLIEKPNVEILWKHKLEEVIGDKNQYGQKYVTNIRIKNLANDIEQTLAVDGVFVAIGSEPQTQLFSNKLDLDEKGYIKTLPNSSQTSIKSVFAAGDVANSKFRQAIIAAGSGCMAAIEADHFLQTNNR